jgi:hypothetical protein
VSGTCITFRNFFFLSQHNGCDFEVEKHLPFLKKHFFKEKTDIQDGNSVPKHPDREPKLKCTVKGENHYIILNRMH